MSRLLDDLSLPFRPLAFEVLARLTERGIAVMIVDTLRTEAEHKENIAKGASKASKSKHLPRRLRGIVGGMDAEKSDAIDLCPYDEYASRGPDKLAWDPAHPAWKVIIELGESLGLRSGGRWQDPHDPGHLELLFDGETYRDIPPSSAAWARHGISRIGSVR